MIAYIATEDTITIVLDGKYRTVQVKSKVHRNEVIKALEKYKKSNQGSLDKEALEVFLAPIKRVALESDHRFELDESENKLFLKGNTIPLPATLADKILDFLDNGLPVNPLVKFWESCLKNPHFVAVEELFNFLERNNLPITDDGGFLGYKKLNFVNRIDVPDDFEEIIISPKGEMKYINGDSVPKSLQAKYLAFINQANNPTMVDVHSGTVKQRLGEVVRIERVRLGEAERRQACGYGLHIGSFGYCFGGNVRVLCKVMPEDVIACNPNEQKLRTCKYQIVSFVDEKKEVKDLLVNLTADEKRVVKGDFKECKKFSNPFTEGDIIKATADGYSDTDDQVLSKDRYYYVVEVDAEDVLIIDDEGQENWFMSDLFVKK